MTQPPYYHINTIGCQMNVYDSSLIAGQIAALGYTATPVPERADVVVVNTCAIREKAEQKVFSFLGRLAELKLNRPELIIAVGGCVAQQEGDKILSRVPHVDLVFGTGALGRVGGHLKKIREKRCRIVDVDMAESAEPPGPVPVEATAAPVARFVTIMQGCDNFCTYCVVPHVRGRERSRHPDRIVAEIRSSVDMGVREVTLLGQNVNSYGQKEKLCSFPELLHEINDLDGLERIRFTTSHPKDLSDELVRCFAELEKLCKHIHLPVQSGSDRILHRMNRRYTRKRYLERIDRIRETCPEIAVTTDFIAGFPGETGTDFDASLDLLERVGFDSIFAFKYSDRPSAPAARFSGKVPETVKTDRLQRLLDAQGVITRRINEGLVGSRQRILVEGSSKKQGGFPVSGNGAGRQWMGRTSQNKIVNFDSGKRAAAKNEICPGQSVWVKIERALPHSLWGVPAGDESVSPDSKGEGSYAA
jgi:tRNA-2-methylthio-N6-dimethylallyladenosine synthase